MKAALCRSLDGPGAIVIEDLAEPVAGPGEVVVAVRAAGLNFMDTLITRGKYQEKPALPFSPGAEIAGVVEALGAGVDGLRSGERVCGYIGWGGARAKVAVSADLLVPVPDGVADVHAAGMTVTYGTAIHGLQDRGRLQAGESIAVLGSSGGAGLAAIEIARRLRGKVIAVASTDEKLQLCARRGADALLNYKDRDLSQGLRDLTGGRGPDVIYDCVGGDHAEAALRAINWRGRYLVVGFATGIIPRLPLNLPLLKGCDVVGVNWGEAVRRDLAAHRANMRQLLGWIADGSLSPHIHATYPLEQTGEAIALLERRQAKGKVIIKM